MALPFRCEQTLGRSSKNRKKLICALESANIRLANFSVMFSDILHFQQK
jgi:hypothetical protein